MSEYDKGAEACDKGEECPENASAEFVRGYGEQYQYEANIGAKTCRI